jgi:hypothetical protein
MIKKIKEINEVLLDLMVGIFLYAILCEVALMLFRTEHLYDSFGILIGFFLAEFSAWYMAYMINKAMYMEESKATNHVRIHTILRYGTIVIVIFILVYTDIANPLSAFLALMGIKVAAYMQPFIHKLLNKK